MNHHIQHDSYVYFEVFGLILFFLAWLSYILAAIVSNSRYKTWPLYRYAFWSVGILCVVITVFGPLANHSHDHFIWHMVGHLLIGMLAPLLLALGAPMTIVFRTLNVHHARWISRILKSALIK